MKINNSKQVNVSYIKSRYDKNQKRQITLDDVKIKKDYNIDISEEGKKLLEESNSTEENDHSKRLESIKKAINDRTYEVSPEKIGAKIFEKIGLQKGRGHDD